MSKNAIELQKEIECHDVLYHQKSKPEITDAEYDELKRKLAQLPGIQDSVGAAPDERFPKVEHQEPMLSLEKAHDEQGVEGFLSKIKGFLTEDEIEVLCEPKIDGCRFLQFMKMVCSLRVRLEAMVTMVRMLHRMLQL